MRRVVVLTRSDSAATRTGYDVRLGPLAFVTPADKVSETLGGGLEAVGAALAPAEPRPVTLGLKLPVRGARREIDTKAAGIRLRRAVRQLLNNARWREHGFYFTWSADPDLDCWVRVGGGTLTEEDPGVTFADFGLELSDVYLVGRPGTHRPGRRLQLADRRTGLAPRDSRRTLYSTDFADVDLPAEPAALPGDVVDLVASGNRPVGSTTAGPLRGARHLWRTASGRDGEVLTYLPDDAVLTNRERFLDLDELGAVRVWDLSGDPLQERDPATYTAERDADPDVFYGWERVFGDVLTADRRLAIDNGAVRLIWLTGSDGGLAVEWWDDEAGHFRREARVAFADGVVREARVIEVTAERAIVEWRAGELALRAILQRGWWGPRLESYNDGGGEAVLGWVSDDGALSLSEAVDGHPVRTITPAGKYELNRAPNPDGETSLVGWDWFAIGTATLDRADSGTALSDTASPRLTATFAMAAGHPLALLLNDVEGTAGEVIAARARFQVGDDGTGTPGTFRIGIEARDATNVALGTQWSEERTVEFGFTDELVMPGVELPDGTAHVNVGFVYEAAAGGALPQLLVDNVLVAPVRGQGDLPPAYFDGDSAGAEWDGTPHESTSRRLMRTPVSTLWAQGTVDEAVTVIDDELAVAVFARPRVVVGQVSFPPGPSADELAGHALVDAQTIPVLVGRR